MELFETVFNQQSIYDTFFLNIKGVLEYPSLELLEKENKQLYDRWIYLADSKYNDLHVINPENCYQKKAIWYPEYTKIVAITYAIVYFEDGKFQRQFKKIVNDKEELVIATFIDELKAISKDSELSTPKTFPYLCGHNIINYDIPFLLKRYIKYNLSIEENKTIPLILKRILSLKPWERDIIDTINVWKFNGIGAGSLMLVANYLGLKKSVDLLNHTELSKYYWDNIEKDRKKTLDYIVLQSATQTNLIIQLMNHLRHY